MDHIYRAARLRIVVDGVRGNSPCSDLHAMKTIEPGCKQRIWVSKRS